MLYDVCVLKHTNEASDMKSKKNFQGFVFLKSGTCFQMCQLKPQKAFSIRYIDVFILSKKVPPHLLLQLILSNMCVLITNIGAYL